MLGIKSKVIGEEEAMKVAMKVVAIDSSNWEKAVKLTQKHIAKDCENRASVAEVLVVKAIDKKRIERAIEWFKVNGANRYIAVSVLGPEFVPPGKSYNKGVVNSIVNKALTSLNEMLP